MGLIGGEIGFRFLKAIAAHHAASLSDGTPAAYAHKSKLEVLLGPTVWDEVRGREVLDFGCGPGIEAVEIAQHGARHVIGLDIREKWLTQARERAAAAGVSERCTYATSWRQPVDVIVSLDSFEHFSDPAAILVEMHRLLRPGGRVLVSFGPLWYHPLGGHVYSLFPFSHLIFTEKALVRWRSTFKTDGARTFAESGLNQMTVRRFERIIAESPFRFESLDLVPIRRLARFATPATREFTTSVVRCRLVARQAVHAAA
jgi:SAM-dependent methyltransferase